MRGSVFQEVAKEKEAEVSVAKTEDSALAARDSTEELEARETLAVSLISSCPLIPPSPPPSPGFGSPKEPASPDSHASSAGRSSTGSTPTKSGFERIHGTSEASSGWLSIDLHAVDSRVEITRAQGQPMTRSTRARESRRSRARPGEAAGAR